MTLIAGNLILDSTPDPFYDGNQQPSLDLRFAEGKNLNDYVSATPLVDHQRSMSGSNLSAGTFVNSSGLIETAKVNLLPYSKDNLGWSTQDMNNDGAVEGPPGEGQATRFTSVGGTVASRVRYLSAFTTTAGVQYTLSIYVKPLNYNSVSFGLSNIGAGASRSDYNFSTGIVTNAAGTADASMEALGNGWWRLKNTIIAAPSSGSIPTLFLDLGDTAAETHATSEGFDVYGGQIEEGVDLNTYIQTIGVPSAAPRFDHDPTTGESLGLLVEESRTNNLKTSNDFSGWLLSNITNNVSTQLSPDGSFNAAEFETTGNSATYPYNGKPGTQLPAGTYTFSVWTKFEISSSVLIYGSNLGALLLFDAATKQPSTATIQQGASSFVGTVEEYPNGWYRLSATIIVNSGSLVTEATVALNKNKVTTYGLPDASGVGDVLTIWGAQLEEGSFPTSYIPTTGTALTRSADVASITGSNFSSWYNPNETTLYIESPDFPNYGNLSNAAFVYISDVNVGAISVNDGIKFGTSSPSTNNRIFVTEAGVTYAGTPGVQASKFAIAVATNDFNFVSDGTSKGTATSVVMPTGMDRLAISSYGPGYAHLSRLTYFPERLPDSSLQTMTTP